MATNFLVHEKIWFDKFKYDDAERKFYEQMNGPVAGSSRQVGAAALGVSGCLCQHSGTRTLGPGGPAAGAGVGSSEGGWLAPEELELLSCHMWAGRSQRL